MPSLAEVKQVLRAVDKNGDGKVSKEELLEFCKTSGSKIDGNAVQAFIKTHDTDGDGKLDLNELAQALSGC